MVCVPNIPENEEKDGDKFTGNIFSYIVFSAYFFTTNIEDFLLLCQYEQE